jgi:lipopolysaccharide/colanic/teichoic acid biosynthesis glycosyltransferase
MSMISTYPNSWQKRLFDVVLVLLSGPLWLPLLVIIGLLVLALHGRPIIYRQKRAGKKGKPFWIFKFRTMKIGAHQLQKKLLQLNEADGPVFKIKDDPRYVGLGKWLAKTGLDELPQLINVLRGEMSLVGPRPLPVKEAEKIPVQYIVIRESVKPGIVSEWVVKGPHTMSFIEWMKMDEEYVHLAFVMLDMKIIIKLLYSYTRFSYEKYF